MSLRAARTATRSVIWRRGNDETSTAPASWQGASNTAFQVASDREPWGKRPACNELSTTSRSRVQCPSPSSLWSIRRTSISSKAAFCRASASLSKSSWAISRRCPECTRKLPACDVFTGILTSARFRPLMTARAVRLALRSWDACTVTALLHSSVCAPSRSCSHLDRRRPTANASSAPRMVSSPQVLVGPCLRLGPLLGLPARSRRLRNSRVGRVAVQNASGESACKGVR